MIVETPGGQILEGPIRKFATGWRLKDFKLDVEDVHYLAKLEPRELFAMIGQLNARVRRWYLGSTPIVREEIEDDEIPY